MELQNTTITPPRARNRGALQILLLAAWFGLVTGVLVAGIVLFHQFALGQLVFHGEWVVWMAPAAHLALFLLVGAGFAAVTLVMDAERPRQWAVASFAFLGTLSILIPFGSIGWWAILLLALGAAARMPRAFTAPVLSSRQRAWIGWSSGVLLLLVAAATAGVWLRREERRDRSAGPGGASTLPSVLLIILDTVRSADLSLYGYGKPTTPYLERLASQATVFNRAFAPAPWTLPSHGSMFTGQLGSKLGGGWLEPIAPGHPSLATILRSSGYRTGGFVANLLYTSYESGLAEGFQTFDDYPVSVSQLALHLPLVQSNLIRRLARARSLHDLRRAFRRATFAPGHLPADEYRPAPDITDAFLAWQNQDAGRPFFAFLNYFDAHGPYRAPKPVMDRFRTGDDDHAKRDRYDAAIAFIDSEIERLTDTLAARGVLDGTVLIIASDHGELFDEHGLDGHANALYLPLLRVPLLVRFPPLVPAGNRIEAPISLVDLPCTVLDLAGLPDAPLPGVSLARAWAQPESTRFSPAIAELSPGQNVDSVQRNARTWLQSITDERHHYIRDGLGGEELFEYLLDPGEEQDIAHEPRAQAVVERFGDLLDRSAGNPGRDSARPRTPVAASCVRGTDPQ